MREQLYNCEKWKRQEKRKLEKKTKDKHKNKKQNHVNGFQ